VDDCELSEEMKSSWNYSILISGIVGPIVWASFEIDLNTRCTDQGNSDPIRVNGWHLPPVADYLDVPTSSLGSGSIGHDMTEQITKVRV
jgi:hypothetical protein